MGPYETCNEVLMLDDYDGLELQWWHLCVAIKMPSLGTVRGMEGLAQVGVGVGGGKGEV